MCVFFLNPSKFNKDQGLGSGTVFFSRQCLGKLSSNSQPKADSFSLSLQHLYGGLSIRTPHILEVSPCRHFASAPWMSHAGDQWFLLQNLEVICQLEGASLLRFADTSQYFFKGSTYGFPISMLRRTSELLFRCLGHTMAPMVTWDRRGKPGHTKLPCSSDC